MKWFKKKKSKKPRQKDIDRTFPPYRTELVSSEIVAKLSASPEILDNIFTFLCPHAVDQSFESCEQSAIDDRCMLCDLRDLAHCTRVSKAWRRVAINVL
jgi:hypothetical protein